MTLPKRSINRKAAFALPLLVAIAGLSLAPAPARADRQDVRRYEAPVPPAVDESPAVDEPSERVPSETDAPSVIEISPSKPDSTASDTIASETVWGDETTFPKLPEVETSASLLTPLPASDSEAVAQTFPSAEEAVPDKIEPGRSTRSVSSYVGIGGNFGVTGDTSIGDSGLIIYSKIGLTRFFSVRPAITTDFSDDATFLLPATFDFAPIAVGSDIRLAPYMGAGVALSTDGDFGPLLTGGVDLPINSKLTATAGANFGILDPVDIGVFLGISYSFSGF